MKLGLGLGNDLHGQSRGGVFGGLLLDQYSGAAAAYSFREISSGTTNVVRVRRSSDNAEQDFTATEVTDGTLETWVGANDGFVTTWYDQSGNSNDATQATASEQPKIVDAGSLVTENEKPALDFDGVDDTMQSKNKFSLSPIGNGWYCDAVIKLRSMPDDTSILDMDNVFPERVAQLLKVSGTDSRVVIAFNSAGSVISIISSGFVFNEIKLFSSLFDGTNLELYDNAIRIGQTALSDQKNIPTFLNIGSDGKNGNRIDGLMSEVIIYPSDQSSNRTAIQDNINSYYNIY